MRNTSRLALAGIMAALAVVIMTLVSLIPAATFCCPVLASVLLIPVMMECGRKTAWEMYAVIAVLSLLFCSDKEAALIFAFLGYYPILKPDLDRIPSVPLRLAAKLGIFNIGAGMVYLLLAVVLHIEAFSAEYAAMGTAMLIFFFLLCNLCMLVYDRALKSLAFLYVKRLRSKLLRRF